MMVPASWGYAGLRSSQLSCAVESLHVEQCMQFRDIDFACRLSEVQSLS